MRYLFAHAMLACVAAGQQVIVPAAATNVDGSGLGVLAGLGEGSARRQMFLIGPTVAASLTGKTLTGLVLRRDAHYGHALKGGAVDLVVYVSSSSADVTNPSPSYAANHGTNKLQVFGGRVSVPASPAVGTGYAPWGASNVVQITFTQLFTHSAGTVCIEIEGQPVPGNESGFWPIDYQLDPITGSASSFGQGCALFAGPSSPADAAPSLLRAGSTASFVSYGRVNTPGFFLLGSRPLTPPMDLSALGATNCQLSVMIELVLPATFHPLPVSGDAGYENLRIHIPGAPAFMGAQLFAQWINLETSLPPGKWSNTLGLTTSNGLAITLAAAPQTLGMATINSHRVIGSQTMPTTGRVDIGRAPVMLFLHR